MGSTVTLSLISHTNVGKTTLARTLLRAEVGEVFDQAHVTDASEAHVLIEHQGDRLELWDTPGFGDTARLMRRLRHQQDPLGWFLHQVWDRVADRPQWCSQQAISNVREQADVVLYLVNAAEEPEDAGYVPLELDLLGWLERPVLLLLNQVGEQPAARVERWRAHVAPWPVVRDVLSLDAYTRSWTEEGAMLERLVELLEGPQRTAMQALAAAWKARNLQTFHASCARLAAVIARTACDCEVPGAVAGVEPGEKGAVRLLADAFKFSTIDRRRAMAALGKRLDVVVGGLMDELIAAHGLTGGSAARIEQHLRDFQVRGRVPLNERSGALAGAVLSGALTGLAADLGAGGLTLGTGLLAGGIFGAIGGSALARGYRLVGGLAEPSVRWSAEFLDQLLRRILLRYLAVAHYGRGRGQYRDGGEAPRWQEALEAALGARRGRWQRCWRQAERTGGRRRRGRAAASPAPDNDDTARLERQLAVLIEEVLRDTLRQLYPTARNQLV